MDTAQASSRRRQGDLARAGEWHMIRGVLWHEWLAHRRLVSGYTALWFACAFVLVLLHRPLYHAVFALAFAVILARRLAGSVVCEGSEEFALALPPPRITRYLARVALGLGVLLSVSAAAAVASAFELPQAAWGLIVDSGFADPCPHAEAAEHVWIVLGSATLFAFVFPIVSLCRSRTQIAAALIFAFLCWAALCSRLVQWETLLLEGPRYGSLAWIALGAAAVAALGLGGFAYTRKEGINRPAESSQSRRAAAWLLLGVLAFVILVVFGMLFTSRKVVREERTPGSSEVDFGPADSSGEHGPTEELR